MKKPAFRAAFLAVSFLFAETVAAVESRGVREFTASSKLFSSAFGLAGKDKTFDYVVVGGGTSGLATAMRISANGKFSVAVIEAGGFYETDAGNISTVPAYESSFLNAPPSIDWKIHTTNQSQLGGRSIFYSQGKTLGGSSARNGMAYQRGTASSYDLWAKVVGDDSYTWDNLLPYFKKSVQFSPPNMALREGPSVAFNQSAFSPSGGPLQVSYWNYYVPVSEFVRKGLEKLGFKETGQIQSGSLLGFAQFPATLQEDSQLRDSAQTSFLDAGILATGSSDNLQIYPNTLAKQIIFSGKKATGVLVNTAGSEYSLSSRNEVIVAGGVFHSPQLLLVSGVGPAETLQKFNIPVVSALAGVGQNLLDNPGYGTLSPVNAISQHRLWSNATYAAEAYAQFYTNRSGPLTAFASNYILWENIPNSSTISVATRNTLSKTYPPDWPDAEYIFNAAGPATNETADYLSVGVVVLKATSRGSVTLNSSNTADNPLVDVNWFATKEDQELGVEGLKRARIFANSTGVLTGQGSVPGPEVQTDAEILEWIKSATSPSHHAVGTCKMGLSTDASAVVNTKGCVLGGISGLRIVDASVMPILPPGQPISTVYAIAEKLASSILAGQRC